MATKKSGTGIPGLSFSWKRALGITAAKQKIARKTGIPTTKAGLERKVGKAVLDMLDPSTSKKSSASSKGSGKSTKSSKTTKK